jgi:hypothetical protein
MVSDIEDKLRSAIDEVTSYDSSNGYLASLIITNEGDPAKFFQFSANTESWELDYPVIPSNNNTGDEAERIRKVVSGTANKVRDGQFGEGLQADLDPETDFVELSKEIIESTWPGCDEIETEINR